jgi:asparagine synthase (glutamine-hydrolysing)
MTRPGDKLHKFAGILNAAGLQEVYKILISHWQYPEQLIIGGHELPTILSDQQLWQEFPNFLQSMMYMDMLTYLPDDILVKIDRAAMGVSLETRVPMLDYRVVEFALRLPLSLKLRKGVGKWVLRRVLDRYVPKALIERPKMGFGIPIDIWLRGPLREWAESLLDPVRLQREGYFNSVQVQKKWLEHLSGNRNWNYYLWDVLMFQAWLEQQ